MSHFQDSLCVPLELVLFLELIMIASTFDTIVCSQSHVPNCPKHGSHWFLRAKLILRHWPKVQHWPWAAQSAWVDPKWCCIEVGTSCQCSCRLLDFGYDINVIRGAHLSFRSNHAKLGHNGQVLYTAGWRLLWQCDWLVVRELVFMMKQQKIINLPFPGTRNEFVCVCVCLCLWMRNLPVIVRNGRKKGEREKKEEE